MAALVKVADKDREIAPQRKAEVNVRDLSYNESASLEEVTLPAHARKKNVKEQLADLPKGSQVALQTNFGPVSGIIGAPRPDGRIAFSPTGNENNMAGIGRFLFPRGSQVLPGSGNGGTGVELSKVDFSTLVLPPPPSKITTSKITTGKITT